MEVLSSGNPSIYYVRMLWQLEEHLAKQQRRKGKGTPALVSESRVADVGTTGTLSKSRKQWAPSMGL